MGLNASGVGEGSNQKQLKEARLEENDLRAGYQTKSRGKVIEKTERFPRR